jgi:undecaprenyl diphosphate synthase
MDNSLKIPRHIAFIMDGNGRWTKSKGQPRNFGHLKGSERIEEIVLKSFDLGVECVSFYAFSTENWQRPKEEVDKLMSILKSFLKKHLKLLIKNQVKLVISGDLTSLSSDLVDAINNALEKTSAFSGKVMNIAFNYGGRQEILHAVNTLLKSGKTSVTEEEFSSYLYTNGLPDIDLMIRTSGEQRTSNFFPWQLVYAELYFTEVLWPDFSKEELIKAIEWYSLRDRRFGKV